MDLSGYHTIKLVNAAVPGITEPKLTPGLQARTLAESDKQANEKPKVRDVRKDYSQIQENLQDAEIDSLAYGLYTTEDIDNFTSVEIVNGEKSGPGSVRDLRMGPHNESQACESCGLDYRECYGHDGRIAIPRICHPMTLPHILLTAQCICNTCSGLLVSEQDIKDEGIDKLVGLKKLTAIRDLTKKISKGCQRYANKPNIAKCIGIPIYGSLKSMGDREYKLPYQLQAKGDTLYRSPDELWVMFKGISPQDARLLGFDPDISPPHAMIMERLIIIAYCVRPDLRQDDVLMSDDLTTIYLDIAKAVTAWKSPLT
jgi:DNA-directed RNA polymerase beta' subunit